MAMSGNSLGVVDLLVIGVLMMTSSSIGLYYRLSGGKQSTAKEYMLADGDMSIYPVAFSLMASFMSAITLLGVVSELFVYGTQFIMINIAYIIATPIVCYFYLPIFFRLQKTSVYEYLELRFGYSTRVAASIAFSVQMVLYMSIVVYTPALAIAAVTGLSRFVSILLVGSVCTFYSSLGGMKAVLMTDVLQSLMMFASIAIVIVKGFSMYSIQDVYLAAKNSDRLEFFNLSVDPRTRYTVWTQIIGGIVTYLSLYAVNQTQVQRLLTLKTLRKSQSALWVQWPILMVLSTSTALSGLLIYTHFQHCDPKLTNNIDNDDQILPYFVQQTVGSVPGLMGLFIAGIFSGSLSTVSSAVNSLAAVTLYDYIQPLSTKCCPSLLPRLSSPLVLPLLSCCYGIACVIMAFFTQGTGVLQASFTVFGAVGGPLLALFTLGMSCRFANQKGALTGFLFGLFVCLWIGFGQPKPLPVEKSRSVEECPFNVTSTEETQTPIDDWSPLHEIYAISFAWLGVLGFLATYLLGILISLCAPAKNVSPELLFYSSSKDKEKEVELADITPSKEDSLL